MKNTARTAPGGNMELQPREMNEALPALESVLCTEELHRRPSRPPDYERESRALVSLAQSLADSPRTILQALADTILKVFQCGSAGISLVTEDEKRFHWPAIAGVWEPHIGGGTPRDFGPCGDVLDRNCPLLFRHFERRYPYFLPLTPPVEECLLVPFYVEGQAVGTIWAIAHDDRRKFDSEDLRMLVSLGTFASAAYQAVVHSQVLEAQSHARQDTAQTLRDMNEALLVSSVRQHERTELAAKADALVRESNARFESLFDASPVGMYLVDADLRIRFVSQKALPVFGDIGELVGRDFREVLEILWGAAIAEEILARFRHTLETGEPFTAPEFSEARFDRPAKESYHWQIHRIVTPDGRFGVVCYFMDISAQMQLSNELRQSAADLSESDHRKNEFLAMLAHELRNPLAPIRYALQIMQLAKGDTSAVVSAAAMMERQISQMVRLVDDLLDVSRISRGRIELRRGRVELASAVHHALEAARPLAEDMHHELTVTVTPQPVWLHADPTRLAQIIGNLIINASKYTNEGGRISVTVNQEDEHAVIRVKDTGIGLAPDHLLRIFDMFVQVDTSLERSVGGLGIGLTLVKILVELHGGTIEARSAGIGHGSEFVVRLPVLVDAADSLAAFPGSVPTTSAARRILVVDDNEDSANSLAELLRLSGHEVHTAYDGLAAVAAAETIQPEVMLLDIGLPKLNGYEVCRRIRDEAWGKPMMIVALTGWGQDEDRERSRDAGFDGHAVKPVDFTMLTHILAEGRPTAP